MGKIISPPFTAVCGLDEESSVAGLAHRTLRMMQIVLEGGVDDPRRFEEREHGGCSWLFRILWVLNLAVRGVSKLSLPRIGSQVWVVELRPFQQLKREGFG